jgi:metallophosphoesterase (TIGR03767 family)
MEITRRDLLRTSAVVGGATALGAGGVLGPPGAAADPAAFTTLNTTLRRGTPGAGGYAPVVTGPGEPHLVRSDLGINPLAGREARRTAISSFAQITDVHVIDAQSPMRVEYLDRFEDTYNGAPTPGLLDASFRGQEMLTAHVAESMVGAINRVGAGPVLGQPLGFALQTGDNSDNSQYNEVRWNIDILDGGRTVRPDSGDLTKWEGVQDNALLYYDKHYYHPHQTPLTRANDNYKSIYGFPTVPGLLDKARKPFAATGLSMPWYTAFGNHDKLVQGNFPFSTLPLNAVAVGGLKLISPPTGLSQADLLGAIGGQLDTFLQSLVLTPYVRKVTADPNRRLLDKLQFINEHFLTTGGPVGHGFTAANATSGTGYYTFDKGGVRFIVLDTVNPNGEYNGSIGDSQFTWLKAQLLAAVGKLVVVASHHTVSSMDNPLIITGGDPEPRVLGDAVLAELLTHQHVIAWVNGHTHTNKIWAHSRGDGTGGIWEINTASHVDWPQQSRLLEFADNQDGTLSIFTTMVDHAGPTGYNGVSTSPVPLSGLARELAANDPQKRTSAQGGTTADRNVELIVQRPASYAG